MICPKCKKKNIKKASFCIDCGYEFKEEEQEKAYKKTIYYWIEKLEDFNDKITLSFITDHIAYKIGSLLIILGIGIFYYFTRGINTRLLNDSSYDLYYSSKNDSYYVVLDDSTSKANIHLYIPNRAKKIDVNHYTSNDKLLSSKKYNKKKGIELGPTEDDYYILTSTYSNNKEEDLKLYIYHKSDIKK